MKLCQEAEGRVEGRLKRRREEDEDQSENEEEIEDWEEEPDDEEADAELSRDDEPQEGEESDEESSSAEAEEFSVESSEGSSEGSADDAESEEEGEDDEEYEGSDEESDDSDNDSSLGSSEEIAVEAVESESKYCLGDLADEASFNDMLRNLLKSFHRSVVASSNQSDLYAKINDHLCSAGMALVREAERRRRAAEHTKPRAKALSRERQLVVTLVAETLRALVETPGLEAVIVTLVGRLARLANVGELGLPELDALYGQLAEALPNSPEALLPLALLRGDLPKLLELIAALQEGVLDDIKARALTEEALRLAEFSRNPVSVLARFPTSQTLQVSEDGRHLVSSLGKATVMLSSPMRSGINFLELNFIKEGECIPSICFESPNVSPLAKQVRLPSRHYTQGTKLGLLADMDNKEFKVYANGEQVGITEKFIFPEANFYLEIKGETDIEITRDPSLPPRVAAVILNGLEPNPQSTDINSAASLASHLLKSLVDLAARRHAELLSVALPDAGLILPSLSLNLSPSTFTQLAKLLDRDRETCEAALSILSCQVRAMSLLRIKPQESEQFAQIFSKVKDLEGLNDKHSQLVEMMSSLLYSSEGSCEVLVQGLLSQRAGCGGNSAQELAVFKDPVGLYEALRLYQGEDHCRLQEALLDESCTADDSAADQESNYYSSFGLERGRGAANMLSASKQAYQSILFYLELVKESPPQVLDAWLTQVFYQAETLIGGRVLDSADDWQALLEGLRLAGQAAQMLREVDGLGITARTLASFKSLVVSMTSLDLEGTLLVEMTEEVVWESDHPAISKVFEVDCAQVREVTLRFDESSRLSATASFAIKVTESTLSTQVQGELTAVSPSDFKAELRVEDEESWGIKAYLTLKKTVDGQAKRDLRVLRKQLTNSFIHQFVSPIKAQVTHSPSAAQLLASPILREGVSEAVWRGLVPITEIPSELRELAGLQQDADGPPPVLQRSLSSFSTMTRTVSADLSSIDAYLNSFDAAVSFKHVKDLYLESLIDGRGSPANTWTRGFELLKLSLKPTSRMGGEGATRAERALFAVLMKVSGCLQEVKDLPVDFTELKPALAALWRHAHTIRERLRDMISSGKDAVEAAEEVVKRCVLLINAKRKHFVIKQANDSTKRERSKSSDDISALTPALKQVLPPSLATITRKTPRKLPSEPWVSEVLSLVTSSEPIDELYREVTTRRNIALKMGLALGQLDSLLESGCAIELVTDAVWALFTADGGTAHFLAGLEGVDPRLQLSVARSFFSIYGKLFERLCDKLDKEPDWLAESAASDICRVLRVLAFPFKYSDSIHLLSLDLQVILEFLVKLAKGEVKESSQVQEGDKENRNGVKENLVGSAWEVLRILAYSCIARPEEASTQDLKSLSSLQETFVHLIFTELRKNASTDSADFDIDDAIFGYEWGNPESRAKYVHSLIWILALSSQSERFCEVVSKPEFAVELVKSAFFSTDKVVAYLSFKVLARVLPQHYTPASFESLISALDLRKVKQSLLLEDSTSGMRLLLRIAAQPVCQASGVVPHVLSTSVLQGSFSLMHKLLKHPEWLDSVIVAFNEAYTSLKSSLQGPSLPPLYLLNKSYSALLGSLSLLSSVSSIRLKPEPGAKVEQREGPPVILTKFNAGYYSILDADDEAVAKSDILGAFVPADLKAPMIPDKQAFFETNLRLLTTLRSLEQLQGDNNEALLAQRSLWLAISTLGLEVIDSLLPDVECSEDQAKHLIATASSWLVNKQSQAKDITGKLAEYQERVRDYGEQKAKKEESQRIPNRLFVMGRLTSQGCSFVESEREKLPSFEKFQQFASQPSQEFSHKSPNFVQLSNAAGHLALFGTGYLEVNLTPEVLFKKLTSSQGCPILTLLLALESPDDFPIGVSLGSLSLQLQPKGGTARVMAVLGTQHVALETEACKTYEFKVVVDQVGSVTLSLGTKTYQFTEPQSPVYNGYQLSPITLESYGSLYVRGLAVYEGCLDQPVDFWKRSSKPFGQARKFKDGRLVICPKSSCSQQQAIQSLIGCAADQLNEGVLMKLESGLEIDLNAKLLEPIVELRLFDDLSVVPLNFEIVPVLYGTSTLSWADVDKRILGARRAPLNSSEQILTRLHISRSSGPKGDFEVLGNISRDGTQETLYYRMQDTQLSIMSFVTQIALVKCPPDCIELPQMLVPCLYKANKTPPSRLNVPVLQLSRDSDVMFLAYSTSAASQGQVSLKPVSIGAEVTDFSGLVDNFDDASGLPYKGRKSALSKHGLRAVVYELSELQRGHQAVKVLARLLGRHPAISAEFYSSELNLRLLTNNCYRSLTDSPLHTTLTQQTLTSAYDVLRSSLCSACEDPRVEARVVAECLGTLLLESTSLNSKISACLTEHAPLALKESKVKRVLSIPGATSLTVEMDPSCMYSLRNDEDEEDEASLSFYRKSAKASNSSKTILIDTIHPSPTSKRRITVQGDTLHYRYVNNNSYYPWKYYKFTVRPNYDFLGRRPLYRGHIGRDARTALWLLKQVGVKSIRNKGTVHALLLYLATTWDEGLKLQAVELLKLASVSDQQPVVVGLGDTEREGVLRRYMKDLTKTHQDYQGLVESSTSELSFFERRRLVKSKKLITLSPHTRHMSSQAINVTKQLARVQGLSMRSSYLTLTLLLEFIENHPELTNMAVESSHPYSQHTHTYAVEYPYADHLQITEVASSKAEEGDCLVVMDANGHRVNAELVTCALPVTCMQSDCPNVDVVEGVLTCSTRDRGWNSVVLTPVFTKGHFRLRLKVTALSQPNKLLIGFCKQSDSYCFASRVGPWKSLTSYHLFGDGRVYSGKTSHTIELAVGCEVELLVDLDRLTATFKVDNKERKTFGIDPHAYQVYLAFGKEDIQVKVLKFEGSAQAELGRCSYVVSPELCRLHFPYNANSLKEFVWRAEDLCAFNGLRSICSKAEGEVHYSETQLLSKQDSVCFRIDGAGSARLHVGLAPLKSEEPRAHPSHLAYSSTGELAIFGQELAVEGFTDGDLIELRTDLVAMTVSILKNNSEIISQAYLATSMHAVLWTEAPGQQVSFMSPQTIQAFTAEDSPSREWGFKVMVKPIPTTLNSIRILEAFSDSALAAWDEYAHKHLQFSLKADKQLVQLVDSLISRGQADEFEPSAEDLLKYPALTLLTRPELEERYRLIKSINQGFEQVIDFIALSAPKAQVAESACNQLKSKQLKGDLSGRVSPRYLSNSKKAKAIKDFIFFDTKFTFFKSTLTKSARKNRDEIAIDKIQAHVKRHRGEVDSDFSISVFSQVMQKVNHWPHYQLRNKSRAFSVTLAQEGAHDGGGPYNEVMSTMCDELMSPFITLFIPSANKTQGVGLNRDCFVVNPQSVSSVHQQAYLFLGKLFGIALRTQNNLNLNLPPLFWKKLALEAVDIDDLKGTDVGTANSIEAMRGMKSLSEAEFASVFEDLAFTAQDSSGTEVELLPGGRRRRVYAADIDEYCEGVLQLRLHENEAAYLEIRRGISTMVPIDLLVLFSWRQLEYLVCGAPTVNVTRLKAITTISVDEDSQELKWFWEVLTEMTDEERTMFLRFVWGRSRLPATGDDERMEITQHYDDALDKLPISHTCGFSLELPKYSSKEAMREKFIYAITNCQAIDLDFEVGDEE
jgi:hypothetical protein